MHGGSGARAPTGHAAGASRLDLAEGHICNSAAQNIGGVCGGIESQRKHGAEIGLAEERPQSDRFQRITKLPASVINKEDLDQQRRAAEIKHIGTDRQGEHGIFGEVEHRQRHREAEAKNDAQDGQFHSQERTAHHTRQTIPDDFHEPCPKPASRHATPTPRPVPGPTWKRWR